MQTSTSQNMSKNENVNYDLEAICEIETTNSIDKLKLETTEPEKLLKCPKCPYRCKRKLVLKRHFSSCHEIKIFKCSKCEFTTKTRESLTTHRVYRHTVTKVKSLTCEHCSYKTRIEAQLQIHILYEHAESSSKIKTTGEKHVDNFIVTKWIECQKCSHKAKSKKDLTEHISKCHVEKETVLKTYSKTRPITNHKIFKHPVKVTFLSCEQCSFITTRKNALLQHMTDKHSTDETIKWHECAHCSNKYTASVMLQAHILAQHNPTDYLKLFASDSLCPHKTISKECLTPHNDSHIRKTREETAKVRTYQVRRKRNNNMIYTDVMQEAILYSCDQCSYRTDSKFRLQTHISSDHAPDLVERFNCDRCFIKFKSKAGLKSHVVAMHLRHIKWAECDRCSHIATSEEMEEHVLQSHVKRNAAVKTYAKVKTS